MLLVTGITGHSGNFFLQELANNNYNKPIRCIVRANSNTSLLDNSGLQIEKVVGSLDDQHFLDEVMDGVDTVLHIASIFHSKKVMEAAVKKRVRRAIFVHTTGIYSKFKSASEEYKQIEQDIYKMKSNSNIGLTILRPTMIYGNVNDQNMIVFIKMVDKLKFFPIIDNGKGLLQPVNGRDLGKGYYQVLMNEQILEGDYILSGKKVVSMKELFEIIAQGLNKKLFFVSVPLGVGVFFARILKLVTLGKVDYIEKVQRMAENRNFSYERSTKDFNYAPMPLEEGLRIEIEQYKNTFK